MMLPGRATLNVCVRGEEGLKVAVGLEVSVADGGCAWLVGSRLRF